MFKRNLCNDRIVVGAFFSAKILLDVCSIFGELNNEMAKKKKYLFLNKFVVSI